MVWVSWPKKASGVPTDLTDNVVRDIALPLGFVDVKVCAVDATWSALKFVIRRELRAVTGRVRQLIERQMAMTTTILALCWAVFIIYWGVTTLTVKRTLQRRSD